MSEKTVKVPNISCNHCVMNIKREVGELSGVDSVEADADTKEVTVKWSDPASWETIEETLKEIGYPPA